MTPADRSAILSKLEAGRAALLSSIDGLSDAAAAAKPADKPAAAAKPAAKPNATLLHEAVILPKQQVLLHLRHRVERDAHDDQK